MGPKLSENNSDLLISKSKPCITDFEDMSACKCWWLLPVFSFCTDLCRWIFLFNFSILEVCFLQKHHSWSISLIWWRSISVKIRTMPELKIRVIIVYTTSAWCLCYYGLCKKFTTWWGELWSTWADGYQ